MRKKKIGEKNSSVSDKASDGNSSLGKTSGSARVDFVESGKSSMCRGSTSSNVSDESSCSSFSRSINRPHKSNDMRWEAIQVVRARDRALGLTHFRLLKRLGCGDIGSVYLAELTGTKAYFAMKVMDKASLASHKKLLQAQTEREILQSLDHPFLPTLYSHFETDKFLPIVGPPVNVTNFVSVRLAGRSNYRIWKAQMFCLIKSQQTMLWDLWKFLLNLLKQLKFLQQTMSLVLTL
ncbi:putative protein kinase AGC-RSK-2 family [Helianthus annuus]|nr:putative protein kinase AGC-RSK-2 family [Helianthus annuus]